MVGVLAGVLSGTTSVGSGVNVGTAVGLGNGVGRFDDCVGLPKSAVPVGVDIGPVGTEGVSRAISLPSHAASTKVSSMTVRKRTPAFIRAQLVT